MDNERIERQKAGEERLATILGAAALIFPLLVAIGVGVSTTYAPWFDWWYHPLSRLGGRPPTAIIFNTFLSVSGVLLSLLAIGLRWLAVRTGANGRVVRGLSILIGGGVSLTFVGIFTHHTRPPHLVVAGLFFLLTSLALIGVGRGLREGARPRLGTASIVLGAVTPVLWPLWLIVWTAWAIPEAISVAAFSIWVVLIGWQLLREGTEALGQRE